MSLQEIRDRTDGVDRACKQVDAATAVEVQRPAPHRPRHELRQAHRSGKRSSIRQRVAFLFARQQQEFDELGAVEVGAAQIIERQRRQHVDRAELSGRAPEVALHADDCDKDGGRYAELLLRARQRVPVRLPERNARPDARLIEIAFSIVEPIDELPDVVACQMLGARAGVRARREREHRQENRSTVPVHSGLGRGLKACIARRSARISLRVAVADAGP